MILCMASSLLTTLGAIVYFILKKPTQGQAPILSDDIVQQFISAQQDLASGPSYSNILDISFSTGIMDTYTLGTWDCMRLCNGTSGCQGFQMNPGETQCQTLTTVQNAWPFKTPGWNTFLKRNYLTTQAFNTGLQNQALTGSSLGSGGSTKEDCSQACAASSKCKSITLTGATCDMKDGAGTVLPQAGSTTYMLYDTQSTNVVVPRSPTS